MSEFQLEHMPRLPCSKCPADYQIQTIEHGKVLVVEVFRKYYSRYVYQLSEYMKWRTAARRNDTMEELLSTFLDKASHITTRHMTKQFPSPGRRWGLVLAEIRNARLSITYKPIFFGRCIVCTCILATVCRHLDHTIDRKNFAVKIISRSRPITKIKHAKNKITRRMISE